MTSHLTRVTLCVAIAAAPLAIACTPASPPAPPPSQPAPSSNAAVPPKPALPIPTADELVSGPLPGGPQGELARAACTMCHSEDYLVQQRLTPEQWKKTVAKMQKFGAPVTDEQAAPLAAWLSSMYTTDLPDRHPHVVDAPAVTLR